MWFAVDSGADHHFLAGGNAGDVTSEPTGESRELQVATSGGAGVSVRMMRTRPNSFGIKIAATHPCIRLNILSVSQLEKHGFAVRFGGVQDGGVMTMPNGNEVKMLRQSGLYWVKVGFNKPVAALVTTSRLRHQRMCHFWQTDCRVGDCEACAESKGQKPSHRKQRPEGYKSTRTGQAVHFDHVGPISMPSAGGARWMLNAIDDYDGWTECYPGRSKTEAADGLREYVAQHGVPESVRTDRDPTFAEPNAAWKKLCAEKNIKVRHAAPYEPEQNGKEERFNRTLLDAMRTIMVGVDQALWPHAAKCASYVWNRVCRREKKSPYYMRYGREPSTTHFRRFGCVCWMRVHQRTKLEPKYKRGVFLGYAADSPAYLVGHPDKAGSFAVSVCYDVKFREDTLVSSLESIGVKLAAGVAGTGARKASGGGGVVTSRPRQGREGASTQAPSRAERSRPAQVRTDEKRRKLSGDENQSDARGIVRRLERDLCEEEDAAHKRRRTEAGGDEEEAIAVANAAGVGPRWSEGEEREKWLEADRKEKEALEGKGTWEVLGDQQVKRRATPIVMLYNKKSDGRFKARAVVLGNKEPKTEWGAENFSPTASHMATRMVLAEMAHNGHRMVGFDIANAFVNADIGPEEEILRRLPRHWGGHLVRLRKALYGLRSAPRRWYSHFRDVLVHKLGWEESVAQPGVFKKSCATMVIYVDDGIITGPADVVYKERGQILKEFAGRVEDPVVAGGWARKEFLGMTIMYNESRRVLKVVQDAYAGKLAERFGCKDGCISKRGAPVASQIENTGRQVAKEEFDYKSCVGALMYLAVQTRPDIMYSVSQLGRHMADPRENAVEAARRVVRYVAQTPEYGVEYRHNGSGRFKVIAGGATIVGFCDSDFGACRETRRSVSGYVVYYRGMPVCWKSAMQKVVTTSSAEAEYVALFTLAKQLSEVKHVASHITGGAHDVLPVVLCDNGSAISIAKSAGTTKGVKHMELKYHYVRQQLKNGAFRLEWVPTKKQLADSLTKVAPRSALLRMVNGEM